MNSNPTHLLQAIFGDPIDRHLDWGFWTWVGIGFVALLAIAFVMATNLVSASGGSKQWVSVIGGVFYAWFMTQVMRHLPWNTPVRSSRPHSSSACATCISGAMSFPGGPTCTP